MHRHSKCHCMTDRCTLWRSPCILPTDIEVWRTREWPAVGPTAKQCGHLRHKGAGVAALAGGDCGGDGVAASFDPELVLPCTSQQPRLSANRPLSTCQRFKRQGAAVWRATLPGVLGVHASCTNSKHARNRRVHS